MQKVYKSRTGEEGYSTRKQALNEIKRNGKMKERERGNTKKRTTRNGFFELMNRLDN